VDLRAQLPRRDQYDCPDNGREGGIESISLACSGVLEQNLVEQREQVRQRLSGTGPSSGNQVSAGKKVLEQTGRSKDMNGEAIKHGDAKAITT
jgi:hypothetical protein